MVNVLFVCMGNICRSPTAEGIFTNLVVERELHGKIEIDSAGTLDYHTGEPPDERAQATARKFGIDISGLRARQVADEDFEHYHYILAMDLENLMELQDRCPSDFEDRLHLLCDFTDAFSERVVPDPYYGGDAGFDNVFRMVETATRGLLDAIVARHFPDHGT